VEASAESDPQDEPKSTTWLSSISVFGRPPRRRRKSELPGNDQINSAFIDHYRCPDEFATFTQKLPLSDDRGFFRFGSEVTCYGRCITGVRPASSVEMTSYDAKSDIAKNGYEVELPFDPSEIAENLRYERYARRQSDPRPSALKKAYYLARPFLGVGVRKHLQRMYLRGWRKLEFPRWPVDATVETLFEQLLTLLLKVQGHNRIPFIWFWPDGYQNCVMMTHDVETARGLDFCSRLMDTDTTHGIRSAFQLVPEGRYRISKNSIDEIRRRGFEVNIHDFNHDGQLFSNRELFLERCARIKHYAEEYGIEGFRAAILYRNADWLSVLNFQYDMSSPATGRLDGQQGGCCSVLPFFIGATLELPVTTIQDYSLFHILNDYSIDLWKQQVDEIWKHNGLASFITHPDYIEDPRGRNVYLSLLEYLGHFQSRGDTWFPLPGEINEWWRDRSHMELVREGANWRVEGPGKQRARIAYATLEDDCLVYDV